jgi:hypothetical protein
MLLALAKLFQRRPGLPKGLIFGLEPLVFSPQSFIADAASLCVGNRLDHALGVLINGGAPIAALP